MVRQAKGKPRKSVKKSVSVKTPQRYPQGFTVLELPVAGRSRGRPRKHPAYMSGI